MSTPVGIIKKFVNTLMTTSKQGTEAADAAFKAVGATSYSVFKSKFQSAQSGLITKDFLEQKCGIRVNNKDTGAITGSDAGGSVTKTNESIVPETAKAVSITNAQYKSFTKNGLKVNVTYNEVSDTDAGENFGYSGATYLAKQKLVTRALYNWWIPESLDLINESLGVNFTDGRANINEINIQFVNDLGDNFALDLEMDYDLGLASDVTLKINADLLYKMTANDKNGTLDEAADIFHGIARNSNYGHLIFGELDRLVLNAMTEITLKANVPYVTKLPTEIAAGLCHIVGGYDFDTTSYGLYREWYYDNYCGYARMRYLAKNYSDGVPDGISYNANKTVLTVSTDFKDGTLNIANTVKTVNASALKRGVKILGNASANSIVSGSGNDSLNGGAGADTLNGGKGNDTLTGGAGKDVFVYSGGKDVITDYAAGDKIKISGTISKSTFSGKDAVFTIGSGTLTVKNGKGKSIVFTDAKGKSRAIIGGAQLYGNSSSKSVTLGSSIAVGDAAARTTAIKITGNKLANTILGGSKNDTLVGNAGNDSLVGNAGNDSLNGGAGNDSLYGGAGNDTLFGGAGKDVFIYTAGKDAISDYASGDKISVGGAISKASVSGKNVVFTVGKGSLTVTGGKDKTLAITDSKGKSYSAVVGATDSMAITLTNSTKSPVTLNAAIKTVNASKRTSAVKITGNSLNNSITGGKKNDSLYGGKGNDSISGGKGADKLYGDAGNDTLYGGAGNDSLWGGAGNDTFIYTRGDGKDVISGFESGDLLQITDAFTASYNSSKKSIAFKVGSGSVTLKNFGSTTTFHVNDDTYQLSGGKLNKK
ncbi:MAG: calcium-binding protein [Quinella sp. 1Q7]|nr:calcium-binding protein [Quinella sp. 1Q7]